MIYLIDDNRRRNQEEYGAEYLRNVEYEHILKVIYRIKADDDINYLKDAKAILIHSSFPDFNAENQAVEGKTSVFEKIKTIGLEYKIPFVSFSNGDLELSYDVANDPLYIKGINKQLFYLRLKDFLDLYLHSSKIQIKILAYGKNFEHVFLSNLFKEIISSYDDEESRGSFTYPTETLKQFFTLAGSSNIDRKIEDILKNQPNKKSMVGALNKILKSFLRYGRDIYN